VYSSAPETTPLMVKRPGFSWAAANEARRRTLATNELNALALAIEAPLCGTHQIKDDQPQINAQSIAGMNACSAA
jgi:hypothetical protein